MEYIDDVFSPALWAPSRRNQGSQNKRGALNFERFASEGNRIVNEIAHELGCERNKAARVLRAVLHAVRDRLPADDAVEFAQGLPMALKGVFIDQYDISSTPVVIRNVDQFLDFIYMKAGRSAPRDFPSEDSLIHGLQAVFFVLENHMDRDQVEAIKNLINQEIVELIDDY